MVTIKPDTSRNISQIVQSNIYFFADNAVLQTNGNQNLEIESKPQCDCENAKNWSEQIKMYNYQHDNWNTTTQLNS